MSETKALTGITRKFRQADPRCDFMLPSEAALFSLWKNLGSIPSPARLCDLDSVCNQSIAQQLQLIPSHAKKAGAERELKRLLEVNTTSSRLSLENLQYLMNKVLLPHIINSQSRFMILFSTKARHLAFALYPVVCDDEIWLVHGSDYPVMLRPTKNGRYTFCGLVYIQGDLRAENLERGGSYTGQVQLRRITLE